MNACASSSVATRARAQMNRDRRISSSWTPECLMVRMSPPTVGAVGLLYTDGLIDAHRGGDRFGEEGLLAFLAGCAGLTAPGRIDRLRDLAATFDEPADDDIALVALSVP